MGQVAEEQRCRKTARYCHDEFKFVHTGFLVAAANGSQSTAVSMAVWFLYRVEVLRKARKVRDKAILQLPVFVLR
ncbi:hypothetical protein GSbR_27280 [Geobacter sp. SVR]|nr:hypothetical protein GSVR_32380 [Geobacter sp. SVR]GCF86128.1 hypothetical protein GSbR_27280 [Geobacter sp. SVR]